MAYTVAQNTTLYTGASVAQKVISFVYFTIVARIIGAANTGQYFLAISFTTIFAVVADFGFSSVLTRETSKSESLAGIYLNTVLGAKTVFGVLAFIMVVGAAWLMGYSPELRLWIALSGITMFFDSLKAAFFSVLRAHRNLLYESAGIIGSQLITLGIGTSALFLHAPLYWLILAYTFASGATLVYSAAALWRETHVRLAFIFDWAIFKQFLLVALPIATAGVVGRLYSYADSIMMSKMLVKEALGWWSVPYKIAFAFQFIPVALSASVYPVMSRLATGDPGNVGKLFVKSWRHLFLIVFPLAAGLIAVARPVIVQLYGVSYLPSVPALQILMISLIFSFLTIITGALLIAVNRQLTQTLLLTLALIIDVAMNLFLIPRIGIMGAAISATVSNFILCLTGLYFVTKVVPVSVLTLASHAWRTFVAAAAMGFFVWWLAHLVNFGVVIVLGALLYLPLLFLAGGIDWEFIQEVWHKIYWKQTDL